METTLKITHNAGFFSCCTIRLIEIMKFFNRNKALPEKIYDSEQFAFYKKELSENIVPTFFEYRPDINIVHHSEICVTNEPGEVSFGDYSKFHFDEIALFINKYFYPSKIVRCMMQDYKMNYNIDFENTCAIFYRGNDKMRECEVTPYSDFINKAKEILAVNPNIKFLVQPDETEFLEAFTSAFPDNCFWFSETPHIRKKNTAIFYELPPEKKTEHGCYFLAAVMIMAQCKYLITHSGNGGMWAVLYRGNSNGVYQFFNKHIY